MYTKLCKNLFNSQFGALFLGDLWIILAILTHTVVEGRPQAAQNNGNSSIAPRFGAHEYAYVSSWPIVDRKLGSVSAVAIDDAGNVVIFHRGSHVWNLESFDTKDVYQEAAGGPIPQHTVLKYAHDTGTLLQEWGSNLFYMPHGLTIDHEQHYWLTDVALHQVFKFDLNHSTTEPVLTLGTRFEPGNDIYHYCKPTAVAVLKSGEFFVADGYCNGRIVKYTSEGVPILSWGRNSFVLTRTFNLAAGPVPVNYFAVPHALTVVPDRNLLCVADREQGRVQCFHTGNGTFHSQYSSPDMGSRLFSVKYISSDGGLLYIINGPELQLAFGSAVAVGGYILEMDSGKVINRFQPNNTRRAFSNPHELAVLDDGSEVYVAELDPQMVHKFRLVSPPRSSTTTKLSTTVRNEGENTTNGHYYASGQSGMSSGLTAGSIGIFSIVSTLIVTSLLVILMARVICFRQGQGTSRTDEVPLRNMAVDEG
ncbi:peptidyl-alpha-hydroxyglycine alpha-amidating lyase 1 [Anopheles maculipalpis]|uniref:peptidyl-alpha-hydroxyglycine alpha-amidating lyase 1 n=1 Tax=Anopheles maculipalpis TaxID=1496333 RepID=UPI00215948D5|nr:peptidyl-alpha-hydroxyglycine alpha-amidating lyase 1 [Anopheles maculipalpis]